MGSERRVFPRVTTNRSIRLRLQGDACSVGGCLVDLSSGGGFVRCSTPVEVGRRVACRLEGAHLCAAHVVWVADEQTRRHRGPGFGLKFISPPGEVEQLVLARAGTT